MHKHTLSKFGIQVFSDFVVEVVVTGDVNDEIETNNQRLTK